MNSICSITVALISLSCGICVAECPVPPANIPSEAAKSLAISKLGEFLKCRNDDPINDQSPCNTFASKGLEALYGVTDFKTGANTHMSANQIADAVAAGDRWKPIGNVLNDDNALCAQSAANAAFPVIAVMKAVGHGHIALIIPGEPTQSSTWGKLAPNSASFFYMEPQNVYVSGPLSKAFAKNNASQAQFYYRIR